MALSPVLRLTLLEGIRTQEAQVLLARMRNPVPLPAADRRLLDPTQPGDRRNAAKVLDDVACQLGFVVVHAPDYRGSESCVNRESGRNDP